MVNVFQAIIMNLGTGSGLTFLGIIIYAIYIARRERDYRYLLWFMIPLVPIVHFFANKKTKKVWVSFGLYLLFTVTFGYYLEPQIADKDIITVSVALNNTEYIVNKQEKPKLINDIKWNIYKIELLDNLRIQVNDRSCNGTVKVTIKGAGIYHYPDFPLKSILKLIKN